MKINTSGGGGGLGKLHYVECTCTLNMLGVGMKQLGPLSNDKLSICTCKGVQYQTYWAAYYKGTY